MRNCYSILKNSHAAKTEMFYLTTDYYSAVAVAAAAAAAAATTTTTTTTTVLLLQHTSHFDFCLTSVFFYYSGYSKFLNFWKLLE